MTVATAQISDALQTLIDSRLDTIDRMLLGRLPRQDRLAIVREVESQIHELLATNDADELTREDVLAVLARLDPPEAYIPDETDGEGVAVRRWNAPRAPRPVVKGDGNFARISGILGLSALSLMLLLPVSIVASLLLESNFVLFSLAGFILFAMFLASVVGLTLGIVARKSGPWAVVGIVTSTLALIMSLVIALLGPYL